MSRTCIFTVRELTATFIVGKQTAAAFQCQSGKTRHRGVEIQSPSRLNLSGRLLFSFAASSSATERAHGPTASQTCKVHFSS